MLFRAGLCVLLFACFAVGQEADVKIRILEGDGAINSIRLRRAKEPVVQVIEASGVPAAGASVTFLLPATGPSGTFGDNGLSLTVQTDSRGMATGRNLRPNTIAGQFRIRATTSWRGAAASASLAQTNAEPVAKSGHGKTIAILAVVAGAVAGGAAAAAHGGRSTPSGQASAAAPQVGGSISAGSPSLGPPR
uniref:Invasin domain-containing protein n=1 Tax=Solibacter usitatus (strain Ellin6076) TaxID=234267 RepID=Q01RC3_SOLUE